jgi:hypothetical protein
MQRSLFSTVNGNVTINNELYHPNESKTTPATVKLTASEKETIKDFCFEHDISVSEFMRNASNFYHRYYGHAAKLIKYQDAVLGLLKNLP